VLSKVTKVSDSGVPAGTSRRRKGSENENAKKSNGVLLKRPVWVVVMR